MSAYQAIMCVLIINELAVLFGIAWHEGRQK